MVCHRYVKCEESGNLPLNCSFICQRDVLLSDELFDRVTFLTHSFPRGAHIKGAKKTTKLEGISRIFDEHHKKVEKWNEMKLSQTCRISLC